MKLLRVAVVVAILVAGGSYLASHRDDSSQIVLAAQGISDHITAIVGKTTKRLAA